MKQTAFFKGLLLISLLAPGAAQAQTSGRADGMRFVPDVEGQFGSLTARADPLGLHIGGSPDPASCEHYQALVRTQGADGTNFLLLTRSGNTPSVPGPDDIVCADSGSGNGNLIVFRMGSREKHGERMRSNRLARGHSYDGTPPPAEDKATIYYSFVHGGLVPFDGEGIVPRIYQHPGGMQLVGSVLAVAVEHPAEVSPSDECLEACIGLDIDACLACTVGYDRAPDRTIIMFFDVSDPEHPALQSRFVPKNAEDETLASAGVVGITPLPDDPATPVVDERYLLVVTGGANTTLFFYRSSSSDLKDPALTWTRVDSWSADPGSLIQPLCDADSIRDDALNCLSPDEQYLEDNWPTVNRTHQTLQFLRQGDLNGPLYLAGARGRILSDDNSLDLYRVDCETPACPVGSQILLKHVRTRHHSYFPNAGGDQLVNFAAASSYYVSPSGELIFYATEHDNDGPDGTIKAAEYRHIYMARDGSPTLGPTASVDGPFEVNEGSHVSLSGSANPPITRAFIQLFDEVHDQNRFQGLYPVVDHADYDLDDFDNLSIFQISLPTHPRGFYRTTRAWSWFAPVGCTIRAFARDLDDPSAPVETKTLAGTGEVLEDPDLRLVSNDSGAADMDQRVSSVDFLDDCDEYYAAPLVLSWDLDRDGSYESTGSPVDFNATLVDGPAEVAVPVQAEHPSGGPAGQATARVIVRNVAPSITGFGVTDGAGNRVNVDVPFALTGLPLTFAADFADPGVLDHQAATLAWGDGGVERETAFTAFDEAFGDGRGAVLDVHHYAAAGAYPIALTVRDDDGGVGTASMAIRVVTPEQAVQEIIDLIQAAIAGAPNDAARADLVKALKALAGNGNGQDGALAKIRAGNKSAAVGFVEQAISWLQRAQAEGANVATLIALLEQVAAALSAA